jgi:hypothetical protein
LRPSTGGLGQLVSAQSSDVRAAAYQRCSPATVSQQKSMKMKKDSRRMNKAIARPDAALGIDGVH